MIALRLCPPLAVAAFALVTALPVLAQDQQSFTALQAAGFAVVATDYIPVEGTKLINPESTGDAEVVTMQKGTQIAVCYFAFSNWVYMNKESLANATLCEVR